jgi:hypothetical protein
MFLHLNRIAVLGLLCLALLISFPNAQAAPFAPVASQPNDPKRALRSINLAEKIVPDASLVPAPAYSGASIFSIVEIPSTSKTEYQEILVISLATTDSIDAVMSFYKGPLSSWNQSTPSTGNGLFLEGGNQKWWGGNNALEGSRVEVVNISTPQKAMKAGTTGMNISDSFPSMKTFIKVTYEKNSSPLIAVDIEQVVANCISHEIVALGGGNSKENQYLSKMAKTNCDKRVAKRCNKDTKGRFCQKYARMYTKMGS